MNQEAGSKCSGQEDKEVKTSSLPANEKCLLGCNIDLGVYGKEM